MKRQQDKAEFRFMRFYLGDPGKGLRIFQRAPIFPPSYDHAFTSGFETDPGFVGSILTELTNEGTLVKITHGIYTKPKKSRFGIVLPSDDKIVQAIAVRDNAKVLPSGMTALNSLGLSTQVQIIIRSLLLEVERTIIISKIL